MKQTVNINLLTYYKSRYNGHKIIYVRFLDEDFVFRTLSKKEYKYIIQNNPSRIDTEDAICNTACIFPEEYEFKMCGFAGLNEYVASLIEDISGLKDITSVLNEYHKAKEDNSLEVQCMNLIKAFIPEYTYEEMEGWTWEHLMKMTARAEDVAKLKGFDWHLKDESEEYMEEVNKINPDNKEFIDELYSHGIDPMFYFENNIKKMLVHDVLDFPLIGGSHWNDEAILDVIRTQIRNRRRSGK